MFSAWLKAHPGVQWISRDRSGDYAQGVSEGAPEAQQIVDRWHLLKNWREALERVLGREYARLKQRQIDSGVSIRPRYKKTRSSSEVAASEASRARRLARYEEVMALWQQGNSFSAISRQLHLSPTTVSKFVHAGTFPERVPSPRNTGHLTLYLPYLKQRVEARRRECQPAVERTEGARIYRRIQDGQYMAPRISPTTRTRFFGASQSPPSVLPAPSAAATHQGKNTEPGRTGHFNLSDWQSLA